MTRNEIVFYASAGITVLLVEIANRYGAGWCVFLPAMFVVMFLGFRAFPSPK